MEEGQYQFDSRKHKFNKNFNFLAYFATIWVVQTFALISKAGWHLIQDFVARNRKLDKMLFFKLYFRLQVFKQYVVFSLFAFLKNESYEITSMVC